MDKKQEIKKRIQYDVKIEVLTPIVLKYKVWAYSPEEAAEMVEKSRVAPSFASKPIVKRNTIKSLAVYLSGTINKVLGK